MTFLNILAGFIGLVIGLTVYVVGTLCACTYRGRKLKRHVIEAVDVLDLWGVIDTVDPKQSFTTFKSITAFLDAHNYSHCFYEQGGAFYLMQILAEITSKRKQQAVDQA